MKHQKTCQNIFKTKKKLNIEIPHITLSKKINHKRSFSLSNNKKLLIDFICPKHNLNYEKYCLVCKEDICSRCYKNNHSIHDIIDYTEISLKKEEIELFKAKYIEYKNKYNEYINKIKEWQNILNKYIQNFEEYMEKNIINAIDKMIKEYNYENLNYNTIIEYRMVNSLFHEKNEDKLGDQKIIKLMKTCRSFRNYENYKYININQNLSSISYDNIKLYNNLINKGNFEQKGNSIIKFLFSNFSLFKNIENDNIIEILSEIKKRRNNASSKNIQKILYEKKKVDQKKSDETHLEKEELPKFNNILLDDDIKENININSIIKEKNKNIFNNNNLNEFDNIDLDIDLNYNNYNSRKSNNQTRPIIFNNNINNFNSINNYQIEGTYSDRSNKNKVYTHKKFSSTLIGFRNNKDINILNQSLSDKEGAYNTIDLNNYNLETYNDNYNTFSNRIFPDYNNINIKKVKEIEINSDKEIFIGFELGNSECRLGVINQDLNCVELWIPNNNNDDDINIPTKIFFKDDKITIGKDDTKNKTDDVIFNFVKMVGKNWNEIEGNKELWGFNLIENTKKPFIKINSSRFKNKIYNIEEILTLFLKNIFDLFFAKIKIKEKKCNLLKINFVISVPNYFSYFQRKTIEKIFLTQLFNKNKKRKENIYYLGKNNIENIQIKNIKIENSSNLGYLYPFIKKNNKNSNVIMIYIEGSSVNISLISASNKGGLKKYEIKDIKWTSFGEEDFLDNFENLLLKDDLNKKSYSLIKLRKVFEDAKKNFTEKNPCKNEEFELILNKNDYEISCKEQFDQIVKLIKEILNSKNQIDNIIFSGNKIDTIIIKEKLEKIIKDKNLNRKLFEQKNLNDDLIVIGATIQSLNLFSTEKERIIYKYKEIVPISFGIEGLDKNIIFMIKKGSQIPIKVDKLIKFEILNEKFNINIYEGDDECAFKDRILTQAVIDVKNLFEDKIDDNFIEIPIQFTINNKFELRVFILDTKTKKRKFECVINFDFILE